MNRLWLFLGIAILFFGFAFHVEGQGCGPGSTGNLVFPGKMSFGTLNVGSSQTQVAKFTNISTSSFLIINSLTALNSQFSATPPAPYPLCLGPGQFVDIPITFKPAQNGNFDTKLRI